MMVEPMPFPFLPTGALVAATVLGGAIAGFVAAMMALDKAGSRIFGAVVSGVVAGARGWRDSLPSGSDAPSSDGSSPWGLRSTAVLAARESARRRNAEAARLDTQAGPPAGGTGLITEDGVEPIETLDRVRPRVR
jgi:hypothetical protein